MRSIIALAPMCSKAGATAPKISQISALHSTDGFRAHGNLAPSVDGGSLQRKCFIVGVLNFCVVQYGGQSSGDGRRSFMASRPEQLGAVAQKRSVMGGRSSAVGAVGAVGARLAGAGRWPRGRC